MTSAKKIEAEFNSKLISNGKFRNPKPCISTSEIIAIWLYFHHIRMRDFIAIQPKNLFMLKTSRFLALLNSYDLFLTLRCAVLSLRCQRKYAKKGSHLPCSATQSSLASLNFSARVKTLRTSLIAQTVTRLFPKNPALSVARQKGILSAP